MAARGLAAKASRAGFGLAPRRRIRARVQSRRWTKAIGALPEWTRQASSAKVTFPRDSGHGVIRFSGLPALG